MTPLASGCSGRSGPCVQSRTLDLYSQGIVTKIGITTGRILHDAAIKAMELADRPVQRKVTTDASLRALYTLEQVSERIRAELDRLGVDIEYSSTGLDLGDAEMTIRFNLEQATALLVKLQGWT